MRYTGIFLLFASYVAGAASRCGAVYGRGVSATEQNIIVNRHNAIRLQVAQGTLPNQPKASNMKRISWDNTLATTAQRIADTCVFAHIAVQDSRFAVGQNLYWAASTSYRLGSNWTSAINAWLDEYKTYNYGTTTYNHYTQLVWANTTYVGCGYTHYTGRRTSWYEKLYVCNYGPAGNIIGETPYNIGDGCNSLC